MKLKEALEAYTPLQPNPFNTRKNVNDIKIYLKDILENNFSFSFPQYDDPTGEHTFKDFESEIEKFSRKIAEMASGWKNEIK